MESVASSPNYWPFIVAAYGIVSILLAGFSGWVMVDRRRLRAQIRAVNADRGRSKTRQ